MSFQPCVGSSVFRFWLNNYFKTFGRTIAHWDTITCMFQTLKYYCVYVIVELSQLFFSLTINAISDWDVIRKKTIIDVLFENLESFGYLMSIFESLYSCLFSRFRVWVWVLLIEFEVPLEPDRYNILIRALVHSYALCDSRGIRKVEFVSLCFSSFCSWIYFLTIASTRE